MAEKRAEFGDHQMASLPDRVAMIGQERDRLSCVHLAIRPLSTRRTRVRSVKRRSMIASFCCDPGRPMNEFPSSKDVEEALKAHLLGKGCANPFVNVMEMSDKTGKRTYVITVQAPLASILQPFLEAR